MKSALVEDRRVAFVSDIEAGEYTLKGAKVKATRGEKEEAFAFVSAKPTNGKGKKCWVDVGSLQATAIEAGLKDQSLPFPSVQLGSKIDVDSTKPNENFVFAIVNKTIVVS